MHLGARPGHHKQEYVSSAPSDRRFRLTSDSIPRCTYRVQLSKDFPFDRAAECADYLAKLGVSHLYCSPVLQAAAGSTHGYDVVDPTRINDELGGEAGFRKLAAAMRERGIGLVV